MSLLLGIVNRSDCCCNWGFIVVNTILVIIVSHNGVLAVTMQDCIAEIANQDTITTTTKQVNIITTIVVIAASLIAIESRHMDEIN